MLEIAWPSRMTSTLCGRRLQQRQIILTLPAPPVGCLEATLGSHPLLSHLEFKMGIVNKNKSRLQGEPSS